MWKKEFVKSLPPYKKNLKHSPVVQLTVDGKVVSKYESVKSAQEATGEMVIADVTVGDNSVVAIKIVGSGTLAKGTYRVVIIG